MEKHPTKKYTSKADALVKLQRYCAYQDRCHQEVRSKLIELGIYGQDLEDVMASLIEENFLNEERFARSLATDISLLADETEIASLFDEAAIAAALVGHSSSEEK